MDREDEANRILLRKASSTRDLIGTSKSTYDQMKKRLNEIRQENT